MSTSKRLAWEILRRKPEYRELWAMYAEALYRKEHAGARVKVLDLLAMEDTVHAVKAGLLEAQEADVGAR